MTVTSPSTVWSSFQPFLCTGRETERLTLFAIGFNKQNSEGCYTEKTRIKAGARGHDCSLPLRYHGYLPLQGSQGR